jgi:hypothetical protein
MERHRRVSGVLEVHGYDAQTDRFDLRSSVRVARAASEGPTLTGPITDVARRQGVTS